ncbi:vitamin K epoxide reductase family protein [Aquimarina rhabdastrellae]
MKNNIESIVENVLIHNGINDYDKQDLELQLQIHPNYPSFNAITDTLDYFNIDNIAVEVPKEALDQLPDSYISLVTSSEDDQEIVSVLRKKDTIHIKYPDQKSEKISISEFEKRWIPKVIAVEHNGSSDFTSSRSQLNTLLIAGFALSIIALTFFKNWDIQAISFLGLSIIGGIFGYFAVRESLGLQSQTMHQFCTTVGNTNCGDVINSANGKLFNNFGIADASFVYFTGLAIYQFFFGFTSVLVFPSLLSIPIIFYALYTQAFKIKKWCAICLAISAITITMSTIAIISLPITFDLLITAQFVALLSLITLGYIQVKEKLVENKKQKNENITLNRFKRDGQIFNHLFSQSDRIENINSIPNEIIIGNPNANFKIISVTNPMCGYCKDAFKAYARVAKSLGDSVQIAIRLSVQHDNLDHPATQISLRLIEIYHQQGQQGFINAYSEWFDDRTPTTWIQKYGKHSTDEKFTTVLQKQAEWTQENNLFYTPASLINGQFYPKKYSYDEFYHFVSILHDSYQSEAYTGTPASLEIV